MFFLINRQAVLQSPSRRYGEILATVPLPVPHFSPSVDVVELRDEDRGKIFMSSAYIENSPFILIHVKPVEQAMGRWFNLRSELLGFLVLSTALILGVVVWGANQFVRAMRRRTNAGSRCSTRSSTATSWRRSGAWRRESLTRSTTRSPSSTRRRG